MNNVPHYLVKLKMHIGRIIELLKKKIQNSAHLTCGLQIHQLWIHLITVCREYCKRRYT